MSFDVFQREEAVIAQGRALLARAQSPIRRRPPRMRNC
jgi:hypothetical protein